MMLFFFSYLFLFDNWLAEDRGTCRRYATLYPTHLTDVTSSTLFGYMIQEKVFDSVLFLSVIWRPGYSIFTRCQRLSCLMATFYLNMVISAMWFNVSSANKVEYKIIIGPLSVSYLQLYVGTIALGISIPFVTVLNTLFRHRRIKQDTVRFVNVRSSACLPYWIHYVGHIVCVLTIVCGFLVTFLYSLQWGGETSNNWLMSIFFGTLVETATGPIRVCLSMFCELKRNNTVTKAFFERVNSHSNDPVKFLYKEDSAFCMNNYIILTFAVVVTYKFSDAIFRHYLYSVHEMKICKILYLLYVRRNHEIVIK